MSKRSCLSRFYNQYCAWGWGKGNDSSRVLGLQTNLRFNGSGLQTWGVSRRLTRGSESRPPAVRRGGLSVVGQSGKWSGLRAYFPLETDRGSANHPLTKGKPLELDYSASLRLDFAGYPFCLLVGGRLALADCSLAVFLGFPCLAEWL